MTKQANGKRGGNSRAATRLAAATLVAALCAFLGCESLENHKCCLFSEGGLFSSKKSEIERATSKDEREALARAATDASRKKEAWEPTDAEIASARKNGIDLKNFVWTTQRPNGGALFPKEWTGPGPAVVIAPAEIAAPVGTDVILVASYIGEDSQYLRIGEKLDWSMTGVGRFMETNPREFANGEFSEIGSNCCLFKNVGRKSQEIDDRNMSTTTTGQLWRINRGTDTTLDDVTILRGQSWASASAFEEGTSTVVVMSDTVANWNKRRAVAEIHWIDAAFRFPDSGVAAVGSSTTLATTVCRRTTGEPRTGWRVRYEVLSGDAGLGPDKTSAYDSVTDANGSATAQLSQINGQPGTCAVRATVYRPATETARQVEIDKRTIHYTWTSSAPLTIAVTPSASSVNVGEVVSYQIVVNNLSDFYQNAVVEAKMPTGVSDVKFDPQISEESSDGSAVRWVIAQIRPRGSTSMRVSLRKTTAAPIDLQATILRAAPTEPPTPGGSNAGSGTNPPVVSPGAQLPPAPSNPGLTPPVTSSDPASVQPSI